MNYAPVLLETPIEIREIVTVHYYEYRNDFYFPGETHDFWEFLCVDKGEVEVIAGEKHYSLKKGDIIFHKPGEFHRLYANGKIAPNLIVASFYCSCEGMRFFEHKLWSIGELERNMLASILTEAENAFSSDLSNPYLEKLTRRESSVFGSEQLIRTNLEQMLIHLRRRHTLAADYPLPQKLTKLKDDRQTYEYINAYLEKHIHEKLTIERICHDNLIGRAQLQRLFRLYSDSGIIEHFSRMKVEKSKQLIRENHYNFSQIADALGYASIHYFSRQFKKIVGMTPSEYASSVKILSDDAAGHQVRKVVKI